MRAAQFDPCTFSGQIGMRFRQFAIEQERSVGIETFLEMEQLVILPGPGFILFHDEYDLIDLRIVRDDIDQAVAALGRFGIRTGEIGAQTSEPSSFRNRFKRVQLTGPPASLLERIPPHAFNCFMPKKSQLTLLGRSEARIPASPDEARLEKFPNPSRRDYSIRFETDDFTSLCPITGQADFARIQIEYVPDRECVETKSLKFYLASYRNVRAFNEAVTNRILDDFVKACHPRSATVAAQFSARGGIALTITAQHPTKRAGKFDIRILDPNRR